MIYHLIKLPFAVIADVITLGGVVNDAVFQNDGRTYTGKVINQIQQEQKLKDAIRKARLIKKLEKEL